MYIYKCKMCGGDIELSADKTFGTCESCGSVMTFPKLDDEQRADAFNRGNYFRRVGEFDKALQVYERIIQENPNDAEAHWCCAISRFGIEYVEDPASFEYIPTCHRASFESFIDDVDYLAAVNNADGITKRQYMKEGARITEVQRNILRTSQNEEPFDVFICYKESDDNGSRTVDSTLAQDIYYQLTDEGLRVFFSRITLEDKAGTEYEPFIFAALNSAKVMLVVGTKPEYYSSVWVKNEWSRYLSIVKHDRKKAIIPCYRDMDPYDLPEQLSVLQSYDMSKIGFIQDLIRGIKKICAPQSKTETVTAVQAANTDPLLRRAFLFLEDGEWQEADGYCERVLDQEPENAQAYLGKLMAELHVRKQEDLDKLSDPLDGNKNYQMTVRFADPKLKKQLEDCNLMIREKKEIDEKEARYESALNCMKNAKTEDSFLDAARKFELLSGYKDAEGLAKKGREKAETCRMHTVYLSAKEKMQSSHTKEGFEQAAEMFLGIADYLDSKNLGNQCRTIALDVPYIEAKNIMENANTESAYKAAAKAFEAIGEDNDAPQLSKLCLEKAEMCRKNDIYQKAMAHMSTKNVEGYNMAKFLFKSISGWQDASEKIAYCEKQIAYCEKQIAEIKEKEKADRLEAKRIAEERRIAAEKAVKKRKITTSAVVVCIAFVLILKIYIPTNNKYNAAVTMMDEGKYNEAITAFEAMDGYKDSADKISECQTALIDIDYEAAIALMNEGKYDEAIAAFNAVYSYKDSPDKISECQTALKDIDYEVAIALMNEGKYDEAIVAFKATDGYKDSTDKISECQYNAAVSLLNDGKIIEAYDSFIALKEYKDSATKASEIYVQYEIEKLKIAEIGDVVYFGAYEQDSNTLNEIQDVEWIVLAKEDGKALVISKYALDCQEYNSTYTDVTWENCSLRTWLNETFMNAAFSADEQAMIATTTVSADNNPKCSTNPGNATTDKVFLLSIAEAENYFTTDEARKCVPTAYAKGQGAYISDSYKTASGEATCRWWLRSPGFFQDYAAFVCLDGEVYHDGDRVYRDGSVHYLGDNVHTDIGCVRPALWINLEP